MALCIFPAWYIVLSFYDPIFTFSCFLILLKSEPVYATVHAGDPNEEYTSENNL